MMRYWPFAAAVGLAGFLVGVWFEVPGGEQPPAVKLSLAFWVAYLLATHILAPWHAMQVLQKRVQREVASGDMIIYPWWSWLFLAPLLVGDSRAKVPAGASAVLIWLACVISAWMLMILSAIAVGKVHDKFTQRPNHAMERTAGSLALNF